VPEPVGDRNGDGVSEDAGCTAETERDREHRLANARRPDQQQICLLLDETQRCELVDHGAADAGLGSEVELLQRAYPYALPPWGMLVINDEVKTVIAGNGCGRRRGFGMVSRVERAACRRGPPR
jgi:hypothetical protein